MTTSIDATSSAPRLVAEGAPSGASPPLPARPPLDPGPILALVVAVERVYRDGCAPPLDGLGFSQIRV